MSEYEQFHKQTRAAAAAQYLIAEAPGFVGIGDHLRGMMYALRAAAATKRVLLLHWEHPGNLTDFLVPGAGIDWRFDGTPAAAFGTMDLKTSTAQMDVLGNIDLGKMFPNATYFSSSPSNKTFLVLKTNVPAEAPCLICPPLQGKPAHSYAYVCLFRFLFKASPLVETRTDEHLQTLYPGRPSNLEYAAVHLRLGQMRGEDASINRISGWVDPLAKFLMSVPCGMGMARQAGINVTRVPLLLLADHKGVRRFSNMGWLANVVAPKYEAVHTKLNSHESHLLSFVDLNLLARAKCLVVSHSGFSNVGLWLGANDKCRMMMGECYTTCRHNASAPICG